MKIGYAFDREEDPALRCRQGSAHRADSIRAMHICALSALTSRCADPYRLAFLVAQHKRIGASYQLSGKGSHPTLPV